MNKYKLQIKHHSEIFETRDLAIKYINDNVKNNSLIGEPSLFLYGSDKVKPNALLVFGAGDNIISIIDVAEVQEEVNKLNDLSTLTQQEIEDIIDDITSVVKACGLDYDTDKNTNRITYTPNIDDEIIRKATNISEAIEILSQYTQEMFEKTKITTSNTNTIALDCQYNDGANISADIKISTYGSTDSTTINDNIICAKEDGIYASSDLLFDEEKRILTFITSGVKDGQFQDDAKKKVIELGEHTVITPNNEEHDVELKINKVDSYNSNISADVKLSEDLNNILVKKDGKLLVSGISSNIKHQNNNLETVLNENINNITNLTKELNDEVSRATNSEEALNSRIDTVEKEVQANYTFISDVEGQLNGYKDEVVARFKEQDDKIEEYAENATSHINTVEGQLNGYKDEVETKFNEQNNKIEEIINNDIVEGIETSTLSLSATKGINNKGHIIKGDVLLSNDKSIIVSDGGISANINVKIDQHNNKLLLTVGNKVIEQDLPGVNLIESIVYDQKAHTIVITFSNGKVATIPVDDLLEDFTFNNISEEPVAIETSNNTDGSVNVAARLKLRSEDNILAVENGLLYASKSAIDDAISVETSRAQSKENEIITKIDTAVADLFVNIQSNSNLINTESERAKLVESEIEKSLAESNILYSTEIGNLNTKVSKSEENINTNTTRINEINVSFQTLSDEVEAEVVRSKAVETQLQNDINSERERAINEETSINTKVDNNTNNIVALQTEIENINNNINVINGTKDEKGSILNIVTHSQEDTLLQAKVYTDTVANTKANVNDVYTKSECDEKFLTEHQDISQLATKEEVNEVKEILTVKVDKSDVYTKDEVDEKISEVDSQLQDYKVEVETKFNEQNDKISVLGLDDNNEFIINGVKTTVKEAIENINTNVDLTDITDEIERLRGEITSLKEEITSLNAEINYLKINQQDLAKATSSVTGIDTVIFTNNSEDSFEDTIIGVDMGEYSTSTSNGE